MDRFKPVGRNSRKIECVLCGKRGYDVDHAHSWKRTHERTHYPCRDCGKLVVTYANGRPRNHTGCPAKKDLKENT